VRRRRELVVGLGLLAAAGCAKLAGLEPVRYEDEVTDGAPLDATDDAPPVDAPTTADAGPDALDAGLDADAALPGPPTVPAGPPGNAFRIDTTEVTFAQYRRFVAAVPADAGAQAGICAFNTSLGPDVIGGDNEPVAGVDWCDARAYCAWAGKRLCGKVVGGADPGTQLQVAEIGSPTVAQFTIACSKGGAQSWPYGTAEVRGACNVGDGGAGQRKAVATFPKCVGGYPGIFDMVGNVFEWIDLCFPQDGGPSMCIIQGGSYMTVETTDCTKAFSAAVDFKANDVGFRCCSK
jgi:formylglycine-generating enzyme